MRIKYVTVFLLLLLCVFQANAQERGTLPRKLIIGGDYSYPPYEFLNDRSLPDGYNVELSKAICQQLNYQPEFRLAKWSLVRQWLDSRDIDLIQGMAFSMERAQIMHFSDSHTQTWRSIFVRKSSPIRDSKGILNATIVIQKGDIACDYLKRINFKGTMIEVPTQEDALKLLDSGEYDAAIVNHMNGMHTVVKDKLKRIFPLPERILQKEYCYASKDATLIEQINNSLLILNRSGQLALIQDRWFGDYEAEVRLRQASMQKAIIYLLPLLLMLAAGMAILIYLYRKTKHKLVAEQQLRESIEAELQREYHIFLRGPVIIYKMQTEPLKPLMISENIDQWGYTVDEFLAMEGFVELIFSEDREAYLALDNDVNQPDYSIKRYRIITKSGELRWVLDYSTQMVKPRFKTLSYGYLMDITSQKNLEAQLMESKEKAEAASLAKSYFVANMSHEIRTPLNGVMGFLQVLMQMKASPEQKEYYEIMYASGKTLMKIINDILDFSKIESGKLDLIKSGFNPRHLIEGAVKTFVLQNQKPDLEIRSRINERIPNVLQGDQLRLKQVLINLLQNAVKFTESGYVEVNVEIYTISNKDIRLLFCVTDTGIGIDPRKQQDIFDNFNQADTLITSKYGGTGLGLSIVKRLVELMSGFIWVESDPGKGSSFFFILPFELSIDLPESALASPEAAFKASSLPPLTGMEVLLVEDEPVNQVVTKRQLEGWKIKVSIAATGQEALKLCKTHNYQAILMDIQMPVMDGIMATQTLRLREISEHKHTPIIAFTAAALVGDRERFLEIGMDDYISKPIDMNILHTILAKYYNKSR